MNADRARAYLQEPPRRRADGGGCADDVARAAELLVNALLDGGRILLCGNGGSAADSQHLAAEFVSTLTSTTAGPRSRGRADDRTSILTAIANDFGFEGVFARQVEALGGPVTC